MSLHILFFECCDVWLLDTFIITYDYNYLWTRMNKFLSWIISFPVALIDTFLAIKPMYIYILLLFSYYFRIDWEINETYKVVRTYKLCQMDTIKTFRKNGLLKLNNMVILQFSCLNPHNILDCHFEGSHRSNDIAVPFVTKMKRSTTISLKMLYWEHSYLGQGMHSQRGQNYF